MGQKWQMRILNTMSSGPKFVLSMMNFITTRPMNIGEVLAEPICFNERITVGNTFLAHNRWIAKGIYCVVHFLNEEGRLLSHMSFNRKFDTSIDFVIFWM